MHYFKEYKFERGSDMKSQKAGFHSLRRLLEEKNIRPSFQRMKILDYLRKSKDHPTAEMIYRSLLSEIPTLSRTTVFSTLKLFYRKGLISQVFIDESEMRYDPITKPHPHFKCLKCGRIFDLDMECPYGSLKSVNGHKIYECHMYFVGICKDCLNKG